MLFCNISTALISVYALNDTTTTTSFVLGRDVYTRDATGFFEAHSLSIPAFKSMDDDKPHRFPIHSLILMFGQQCRPIFSDLPVHY